MGKNKKRPPGYAPYLEFYLRRDLEGGKLRVPGEIRGRPDAQARRECLVLVHGFNNSDSGAGDAYLAFRNSETRIFSPIDASVFERSFGDTFWPGDADWSFFDKLDFLVYPAAVHTAAIAPAVRWASAITVAIGFVPVADGKALASPTHTPFTSCSSP